MTQFIHVGFGNIVNADKIIAVVSPDAAPIKRMVQNAKEAGTAVDATQGRKTKAVLVMENGHVVLSALLPETLANRALGGQKSFMDWNLSDTAECEEAE